jgi:Fe-S-cluster containining protein
VPAGGDGYVRLFDIDLERLRGSDLPILRDELPWSDRTEEVFQLGIRLTDAGRRICIAFEGEVGGRCGCGIYEQRPDACRKFEAGSSLCLEARRAAGLPV